MAWSFCMRVNDIDSYEIIPTYQMQSTRATPIGRRAARAEAVPEQITMGRHIPFYVANAVPVHCSRQAREPVVGIPVRPKTHESFSRPVLGLPARAVEGTIIGADFVVPQSNGSVHGGPHLGRVRGMVIAGHTFEEGVVRGSVEVAGDMAGAATGLREQGLGNAAGAERGHVAVQLGTEGDRRLVRRESDRGLTNTRRGTGSSFSEGF